MQISSLFGFLSFVFGVLAGGGEGPAERSERAFAFAHAPVHQCLAETWPPAFPEIVERLLAGGATEIAVGAGGLKAVVAPNAPAGVGLALFGNLALLAFIAVAAFGATAPLAAAAWRKRYFAVGADAALGPGGLWACLGFHVHGSCN